MPIRPIDLQTMIPKVQEHKQSRDSTVNQSDTNQQQANMKNKEIVDQKLRQVNRMDRRDQMKIRDEGRRQKNKANEENKEDQEGKDSNSADQRLDGTNGSEGSEVDTQEGVSSEKAAYDKEKKLKSLQYHKFDMKV